MRPLRVLYDLASLGMAHLSGHRTGVAHAAEELARALAGTPGCELRLMATDVQGAAADAARARLPGVPFAHRPWQTAASRLLYRRFYPNRLMSDPAPGKLTRAVQLGVKAALAPARPLLRRLDRRTFEECDVYHAPSGVVPAQFGGAGPGARPVFLTVHDMIPLKHPEFFPGTQRATRERWLAAFTRERWYLCSSENTRADLLESGRCDPARVFVTPLAAGAAFAPQPEAGPAVRARYGLGDAPYLLSVCTLEPRKNLDTVIRTFLRLVEQEGSRLPEGLRLVLVGASGWMQQKIRAAHAGTGGERIVFTGYVPEADLPALYSHALAFVYLSFYEGFGLPALEAMQCGLPVVASNGSSLPEVVGDAGILQDPRDEDALAGHLLALCNDPALRADLSRRALARAAGFSWARCAALTLAAYRAAV